MVKPLMIFSSEYKLHLPTEAELISAVEEEKSILELQLSDDKSANNKIEGWFHFDTTFLYFTRFLRDFN